MQSVISKLAKYPMTIVVSSPKEDGQRKLTTAEAGVFGAPTMYVGDQMFFGNGRLFVSNYGNVGGKGTGGRCPFSFAGAALHEQTTEKYLRGFI